MTGAAGSAIAPWVWALAAYLIGSLPFGQMMAGLSGLDLRQEGSGNIGATNVWRTLGPVAGIGCFVLDSGKGFVPTWGAMVLGWPTRWAVLAGALAMAGHVWSCFLGFRGGKAVATGVGVILALCAPVAGAALATWIVLLASSRMVSLASVGAALSIPGWMLILPQPPTVLMFGSLVAIAIPWFHRHNLARIWRGEEPRITVRHNRMSSRSS